MLVEQDLIYSIPCIQGSEYNFFLKSVATGKYLTLASSLRQRDGKSSADSFVMKTPYNSPVYFIMSNEEPSRLLGTNSALTYSTDTACDNEQYMLTQLEDGNYALGSVKTGRVSD